MRKTSNENKYNGIRSYPRRNHVFACVFGVAHDDVLVLLRHFIRRVHVRAAIFTLLIFMPQFNDLKA